MCACRADSLSELVKGVAPACPGCLSKRSSNAQPGQDLSSWLRPRMHGDHLALRRSRLARSAPMWRVVAPNHASPRNESTLGTTYTVYHITLDSYQR
jgi:hypothetical protein